MPTASAKPFNWPLRAVPRIRAAGRFPLDDQNFSVRYFSATHALHLYEYEGQIRFPAESFALRPGDVTLTLARMPTSYDVPQPGHHWCVHFDVVKNRPANSPSALRLPVHRSLGAGRVFAIQHLMRIAALFRHGHEDSLARAAAAAAFAELLIWLAMQWRDENARPRPTAGDAAIDKLAGLLDARFTQPLSVPDLADELEITQNHLARCFRRKFAVTIPRYLLLRRIGHARMLLTQTNMPIHRIAQRVGLADPQHFNKQFRRVTGMSPSEFRRRGMG